MYDYENEETNQKIETPAPQMTTNPMDPMEPIAPHVPNQMEEKEARVKGIYLAISDHNHDLGGLINRIVAFNNDYQSDEMSILENRPELKEQIDLFLLGVEELKQALRLNAEPTPVEPIPAEPEQSQSESNNLDNQTPLEPAITIENETIPEESNAMVQMAELMCETCKEEQPENVNCKTCYVHNILTTHMVNNILTAHD